MTPDQRLQLFLPCAAGVEHWLADEVHAITGLTGPDLLIGRAGVLLHGAWRDLLLLNLHSRLAQRVLLQVAQFGYRTENEIYEGAGAVAWEQWFTPRQSFRVAVSARCSPLHSLHFAALRVKDAVADRFRARCGQRPDVQPQQPDVRIQLHLDGDQATLYLDSSGQALFKRGWREDQGEAPLKETLAAAVIAASAWEPQAGTALYDPCCGSGTLAIEAAQIACRIAPGRLRRFAFEKLLPFRAPEWSAIQADAESAIQPSPAPVFASDVAHRMVDFAARNAARAGVSASVQLRGGDALQRLPPCAQPGLMLLNPPYGARIAAAGAAGENARARAAQRARGASPGREAPHLAGAGGADGDADGAEFFRQLAAHWKKHYAGWSAWILSPDARLPGKMRLKETRRVPLWNGPIECRLLRFDMVQGQMRPARASTTPVADAPAGNADGSASDPGG